MQKFVCDSFGEGSIFYFAFLAVLIGVTAYYSFLNPYSIFLDILLFLIFLFAYSVWSGWKSRNLAYIVDDKGISVEGTGFMVPFDQIAKAEISGSRINRFHARDAFSRRVRYKYDSSQMPSLSSGILSSRVLIYTKIKWKEFLLVCYMFKPKDTEGFLKAVQKHIQSETA